MKLQTLAYTILTSQSILLSVATAKRTLRGSINHHVRSKDDGDKVSESGRRDLSQSQELDQDDDPNNDRDLRAYRMFAQGVEPELRSLDVVEVEGGSVDDGDDSSQLLPSNYRDPRIIGGESAGSNDCPSCVSLQDDMGHFCGGSLIAPNLILTAAHCLGGDYDVVAGSNNVNGNGGQKIAMSREIRHPNYNSKTTDKDFAILKLESSFTMNSKVGAVPVNQDSSVPAVRDTVTVMGWGLTQEGNSNSLANNLMKVDVDMISNSECDDSSGNVGGWEDNYNGQITNNMMCATVGGGKDACQGDSGGPLFVQTGNGQMQQVGVVSWGIGCASAAFPGVYSRVSAQYDWIREVVCDNGENVPDQFNCDGSGNANGGSGATPTPPAPTPPAPTPPTPSGGGGGDSGSGGVDNGNWRIMFTEDFDRDYGVFKGHGQDTSWKNEMKFRNGVVNLQLGSSGGAERASITTDGIDVTSYSTCRAVMDMMFVGMESDDEFCAEYSTNGGSSFKEAGCLSSKTHNNKRWHDGEKVPFNVGGVNTVLLRLRCKADNRKDDVLVSKVALECQK